MRIIVLSICSFLWISTSAQKAKFYIDGYNIETNAFEKIGKDALVKVVLINNSNSYRFKIEQVSITITKMGSANAGAYSYTPKHEPKQFTIRNTSNIFATSPAFTFSLTGLDSNLLRNGYYISFRVKKITSSSSEGNEWINNYFFRDIPIKWSIKTDNTMGDKSSY